MPLASLRCRSARFDDGRLNQKVEIAGYDDFLLTKLTKGTLGKGIFRAVALEEEGIQRRRAQYNPTGSQGITLE